jgi:hypothetical protein
MNSRAVRFLVNMKLLAGLLFAFLLLTQPALGLNSACSDLMSGKRPVLSHEGWSSEDLHRALSSQGYDLSGHELEDVHLSLKILIDDHKIENRLAHQLLIESRRPEFVDQARLTAFDKLWAVFLSTLPISIKKTPADLAIFSRMLNQTANRETHAVEVGAWMLTLNDGRTLVSATFTDSRTDSISPAPHLKSFLHEHHLKFAEIKRLAFYHTHPVNQPIDRTVSISDILQTSSLQHRLKQAGINSTVEVYAVADDGTLKTISHYSRPGD